MFANFHIHLVFWAVFLFKKDATKKKCLNGQKSEWEKHTPAEIGVFMACVWTDASSHTHSTYSTHTFLHVNTEEGLKNVISNEVHRSIKDPHKWMSCTHTGEQTAEDTFTSVSCFFPLRVKELITWEITSWCKSWCHFLLSLSAGRKDESHAGDFLDSAVCSRSQRSGY